MRIGELQPRFVIFYVLWWMNFGDGAPMRLEKSRVNSLSHFFHNVHLFFLNRHIFLASLIPASTAELARFF
jgi:hypothetical protein